MTTITYKYLVKEADIDAASSKGYYPSTVTITLTPNVETIDVSNGAQTKTIVANCYSKVDSNRGWIGQFAMNSADLI